MTSAGSGKIWILVADWSRCKSSEPNTGDVTRKTVLYMLSQYGLSQGRDAKLYIFGQVSSCRWGSGGAWGPRTSLSSSTVCALLAAAGGVRQHRLCSKLFFGAGKPTAHPRPKILTVVWFLHLDPKNYKNAVFSLDLLRKSLGLLRKPWKVLRKSLDLLKN